MKREDTEAETAPAAAPKPARRPLDIAHSASNPHVSAEAAAVLDAIRLLPEAYRDTLMLRLVEGYSGPEIASLTGLTPGSVRVNLHRGFKLLKERMGST
jgi:RNA polymerase sigma-70 factor (ECF subfamily)